MMNNNANKEEYYTIIQVRVNVLFKSWNSYIVENILWIWITPNSVGKEEKPLLMERKWRNWSTLYVINN